MNYTGQSQLMWPSKFTRRLSAKRALVNGLFCGLIGMALLVSHGRATAQPHLSIDLDSGRVLSSQQAFDPWYPASLTKLMTAYVVFRAIDAGDIAPDSPVKMSKNAVRQPPSKMGYRRGTVMTFKDAITLLLVKSANDVSVALAESLAGSVNGFAVRMNREASRLGMTGTRFVNPHGLHDRRQVTTARDMALLVRALHRDYPQYGYLFSAPSLLAPKRNKKGKIVQRVYFTYNLLLERFRGADGFKTGFVCASGYNFVGAATRSGRRIAAVVLGRNDQTERAVDSAKLIAQGFRQPNDFGVPIKDLKPKGAVASSARNMRPKICTEAARKRRYDPAAGQAVIDSPWLDQRKITKKPLVVRLGGATGPVSAALDSPAPVQVPLPTFRPSTGPKVAKLEPRSISVTDVLKLKPALDAQAATTQSSANTSAERRIAVPTFRPRG